MPRTLYAKLSLVLVLVLSSIGIIYALISTSTTRHFLQEIDQQLNRELSQNLVADRNLVAEGRIDHQALKETFHQYMVINPSIEIYLLDTEGNILSYSADPGKVKRKRVSLAPINAFLSDDDSYPLLGDDPRSHDRRKAFSVTPVPTEENPEGYLYVVLRGEQYDEAQQLIKESYFLRLSGWAVAGSLIFGLVAGLLLFALLTRRLNRLSSLMDVFRSSGFEQLTPYETNKQQGDEIDKLGMTFNQMAQRITEQLEELRNQDALRRELIANVSHDLRTPLAILHGYLETLKLKGDEVDKEKQNEYLNVALRNSEHLGHLVAELFELAKLDTKETKPLIEPFPPAELAQDVLQKFQLKAKEKGVDLKLEAEEGLPFVSADIGLIERVLENLIANAITHTPCEGHITLKLTKQEQGIHIEVSDSGSGIPEQDIPHIFERFYRAGNSNSQGSNTGLGLAITKRILELHGSDIRVDSQLSKGTTFLFNLPRTSEA
jgi:signal transduction histidine kinase